MPWPSWKWQRIALFSSFAIGLVLLLLVHHAAAIITGLTILVVASYACIKTRCLHSVRRAGTAARFAGGFAIVLSLCGMGLIAVFIGAVLAVPALILLFLLTLGGARG